MDQQPVTVPDTAPHVQQYLLKKTAGGMKAMAFVYYCRFWCDVKMFELRDVQQEYAQGSCTGEEVSQRSTQMGVEFRGDWNHV
jgi:hypothetical protein